MEYISIAFYLSICGLAALWCGLPSEEQLKVENMRDDKPVRSKIFMEFGYLSAVFRDTG